MTLRHVLPKLNYPTRLEKLVDGWMHAIALVLFTIAAGAALGLAIWQGGLGMASATAVYVVCLLTMLSCSLAYNMTEQPKRRALLRRFDHAAIFLMIAGTYTPFTTIRFDGAWAISMTTIVWALAIVGAAGKLFLPGIGKRVWLVFYVLLGWLILAALGPMLESVPVPSLILLAIGGALYTIGVLFYALERLPFRRAIWHAFVITAAGVHYAAVLTGVVFA